MSLSEVENDPFAGDQFSGTLAAPTDIEHLTIVEHCGCAACQSFRDAETGGAKSQNDITAANPEGDNIGELLPLVTNADGSRSITGDRNVDATLIGSKWGVQDLTFSFPTSGSNYNGSGFDENGVSFYHIGLGAQQAAAARAGFAQIAAWTNLTLTEITETDTVHANIRISQSADADVGSAYGGFPSDTRGVAGDIWFGRTNQPFYDLAVKGTWGYSTMLHEIGHTMGLKHGHQDYTNLDLSFFFGAEPRFGTQSLTPDKDGQAWSLMTYTPAPFSNDGFAGEKINQPQTFMQYDLAALQYMYGANYTTNAGDSVYTWSGSTGEMFIDGVGQGAPSGNKILLTIWDGGGNDTIDASNYAGGVSVDLRPGEFTTLDTGQLANHLALQNLTALAPGNIAMSLLYNNDARSLIENAKGGAGDDVLIGNIANNILDGGAGSDSVLFTNPTGVSVTLNDSGADVIVAHDGETDTLRSIENIGGTSGNDALAGNAQNNTLTGGSGGLDTLAGGAGDDRLIGGGFTVINTTVDRPDIVKPESTSNISIETAIDAAGAYALAPRPDIANSTTIPHATIIATAAGGGLEYYRIDVAAGAAVTFDIDTDAATSSLDSWIEVVDSSGTLLANNDTGNSNDTGGTGNDDARLTFTFATAGTYYVRVGQWTTINPPAALPLTAGQTYTLHISNPSAAADAPTFVSVNTSVLNAVGDAGNDFLQGTLGDDTLDGGTGADTASFVAAFSNTATGVMVDLTAQGSAQDTGAAGIDILIGFENLVGSQLNDTLIGDGNDNVIEGGLGADLIAGGSGIDTASYAGATAGVTVSLGAQGMAQDTVNAGTDTLSGFENLLGSAFNDTLTGDAAANVITGGAGNDTLNPGPNADGTVDLLDGGAGSDTASFAGQTAAVTATLNGASVAVATVEGAVVATLLRSIENLLGGTAADILTGDANANVIDGGLGDDVLVGGAGADTISFASRGAAAITVDLAILAAQNTGAGTKTISGFENVRATAGNDSVTGDAGDNVFFESGGNDVYNGASGSDTLDFSAATSTVAINLNAITAQNTGLFGGSDTITNIENVVGAATFANALAGNALANRLTGGLAVDTIIGNGGADVIVGGAGNDVLLGGSSAALDDGSADVLEGGAGNDFLAGGQGNDTLRGGDGEDTLLSGVGNTGRQFFTGVDGGDDSFDGGGGTDIAIMIYDGRLGVAGSTVGISFDVGNFAGDSAITFNGISVGALTSIERVTFRGTQVNDMVRGGGTLDSLTGLAGDDILDGWIGNDVLSGGLGNDILIGGEGLDTATYINSASGVNVDLRIQGVAQDTGGEGVDTLFGIEYLAGSSFGDSLRGDDSFNLITDTGTAAASVAGQTDSLFGYGGNDSILVTRAATAVATNITLDGGDGDDFLELRAGVLSAPLQGNAAGLSTTNYLAGGATSDNRNVDIVTVDGGAGNDRIVLTGVASATVNAGSGADIVSISLRGATTVNNYQLTLGAGADIVQLGVGANADMSADVAVTARTNRITDFEVGDAGDRFEMSNFLNLGLIQYGAGSDGFASGHVRLVQSGTELLLQVDRDGTGAANAFVTIFEISNGYTGGFTAFNFDGFIGNLTLTGFAGNETITGATGRDTLSGGGGDDVLIGGAGADLLIGGAGFDTASYATASAGVSLNLLNTRGSTGDAAGDRFDSIEAVVGSAFDDVFSGTLGADRLDGADGNDVLLGGRGADTLIGGDGSDVLAGGVSADVFRFDMVDNGSIDIVTDFFRTEGDSLVFGAGVTVTAASIGFLTTGETANGQALSNNARAFDLVLTLDSAAGSQTVHILDAYNFASNSYWEGVLGLDLTYPQTPAGNTLLLIS